MPYRQVTRSGTRNVTQSRDVVKQDRLGYTEITVHRPKIMFFEFQGLRPNIPHWIFFGNKQVTKYCNTSYSLADYTSAARDSKIKEVGDAYVAASSFPTTLGGATNGGGNNPLTSGADGSLKGFFYLQSNALLNWSINTDGINFSALDVSTMSRNEALSYAATKFYGNGQYEDWYEYSVSESRTFSESYTYSEQEFYNDPPSPPPPQKEDRAPTTSIRPKTRPKKVENNFVSNATKDRQETGWGGQNGGMSKNGGNLSGGGAR